MTTFDSRNCLLNALSPGDLALLAPHLCLVALELRQTVEAPNAPIEHCYFVEGGIISIVAVSARARSAEVGLVGPEGMTGLSVVMGGDRSPNDTYVQVAGSAQRLPSDRLREAMITSPTLQQTLLRYAHAFLVQTTHTALANGTAKIAERLSRWILMCQDRVGGDELPLTHELLAVMLAVRRPGVTDALHMLEGMGLIRAARGQIRVIDRTGLIATSDGCYGVPEAEYERLLG